MSIFCEYAKKLWIKSRSRSGGNELTNVKSCIILWSGEGLTSFNKHNSANFSSKKKENEAFRGVYFLRVRKKTLSQISFLKSFSSSNLKVSTYKPWKQVLNQLHDSTFIPFLWLVLIQIVVNVRR